MLIWVKYLYIVYWFFGKYVLNNWVNYLYELVFNCLKWNLKCILGI